ncbi:hypothetical protein D9M73_106920 [compost metagenome]
MRLGERGEDIEPLLPACLPQRRAINLRRGIINQRARRLGLGFHPKQHPAHIGMLDDLDRLGAARSGARRLHTLQRIADRRLRRGFRHLHALQTDIEPRIVHHREHRADAAEFAADQLADAVIVVAKAQHASRRGVQPHLMLDRNDADIVERTRRAIGVQPIFRHQEQGNPLGPGRCPRRAREHEVDDIGGHVMVAKRDIDLGALDAPFAIAERLGLGAQSADIGARLRLGQVHRPGPCTGRQMRQILRLLCGAAMMRQRLDRADRQRGGQRKAHIGAAERIEHRGLDRKGQALPTEFLRHADRAPATLDIILIGLHETLGHHHAFGRPFRTDGVARAQQRRPFARRQLPNAFEHGIDDVIARGGETVGGGEIGNADDMIEHEALIGGGGGEHRASSYATGFARL